MRYAILLLSALLCGVAVHAQDSTVLAGIKAGPVLTSAGSVDNLYSPAFGGTGGLTISFALATRLRLQLEILYSAKGYVLDDNGFGMQSRVLLHYMEFPLLLRLQPGRHEPGALHFDMGGYAGFLVDGSISQPGYLLETTEAVEGGILLGAGIDYTIGGYRLGFDLRYSAAFVNSVPLYDYIPEPTDPPSFGHNPTPLSKMIALTATLFFLER